MAFDFSKFGSERLDEAYVAWLIEQRGLDQALHYERLWSYYRNEMIEAAGGASDEESLTSRPYRQEQEFGLPSRLTGVRYGGYGGVQAPQPVAGVKRKEVVIENDIAWRIDTLVDFLFGKPVTLVSKADNKQRAGEIDTILASVLEANGGADFLRQLALLGSVYGFVDVILRLGWETAETASGRSKTFNDVLEWARRMLFEAIEAPRSLPILDENHYRTIKFYVQHFRQCHHHLDDGGGFIQQFNRRGQNIARQKQSHQVEVIGPDYWQRYEDGAVIAEGINPLGVLPVVHIQNMALPHCYEGQSDVEPLMALQDELNTRLSDRASRVTFQSFKMYLGKGIEGFENRSIGPGRMWSTENPDAEIEEFGGDEGSPSENEHLRNIREAMEKASGVGSVAAGILTGKVGNLTSAVALRVTLMGLLSKTERKRRTYGQGIKELCRLVLLALDKTGIYPNKPSEREVEIRWANPLPENLTEQLEQASMKKALGVPAEQVLAELGYQV